MIYFWSIQRPAKEDTRRKLPEPFKIGHDVRFRSLAVRPLTANATACIALRVQIGFKYDPIIQEEYADDALCGSCKHGVNVPCMCTAKGFAFIVHYLVVLSFLPFIFSRCVVSLLPSHSVLPVLFSKDRLHNFPFHMNMCLFGFKALRSESFPNYLFKLAHASKLFSSNRFECSSFASCAHHIIIIVLTIVIISY